MTALWLMLAAFMAGGILVPLGTIWLHDRFGLHPFTFLVLIAAAGSVWLGIVHLLAGMVL